MTQILNLPQANFPCAIGTNEPWIDSWGYIDANGNPIAGAGITLVLMARAAAADPATVIVASNVAGPYSGISLNGSLFWGGAGGNVITLAIPQSTIGAIPPGQYVCEVLAIADGYSVRIALIDLTVVLGIVR